MVRVLIMITVAGFVLSVAALSAAFAIGGPDAIARGGWHWADGSAWSRKHGGWDEDDRDHPATGDLGPQATRTLAWSGAERLDIDLAADVRYIQATGPATVVVTGPQQVIDRVIIRGDSIRYERGGHHRNGRDPTLTIVVRAPNISSFDLSGRNTLTIEGYRQARLRLDVSGRGEVTATGEAEDVTLDLSGSGEVDLSALKTKAADVEISGSADAIIAPTERAQLDISGSGDVRLLTRPKTLETDISGAGRVRQETPEEPDAVEPPTPAPKGAKT